MENLLLLLAFVVLFYNVALRRRINEMGHLRVDGEVI